MKFRVTMKDPDTLDDSVNEACMRELPEGLDEEERHDLAESRSEKVRKLCRRWFSYGEYLTVEIDTDAQTCVVVPQREA